MVMFNPILGTQAGAQLLLQTLQQVSNASSAVLDQMWVLLLQGEVYRLISSTASSFGAIFLVIWIWNHFRNQGLKEMDERRLTGSVLSWLFLGFIIFGLVTPTKTGAILYGMRNTANSTINAFVDKTIQVAGNPTLAMATIISGQAAQSQAVQQCQLIGDPIKREECLQQVSQASQNYAQAAQQSNFAQSVQTNLSGGILNQLGDALILTLVIPFLVAIGTAFLIVLDAGQLVVCLSIPWVLLMGIADPSYVAGVFKNFFSWALVGFAYRTLIVTIAYAMLSADFGNTLVFAIIVGVLAPFFAYQAAVGNALGVMSGVASVGSALMRYVR
ncbi:MAG: hypothetical protein ACRCYP_01715 [Alphaproteobacteria bacterium]